MFPTLAKILIKMQDFFSYPYDMLSGDKDTWSLTPAIGDKRVIASRDSEFLEALYMTVIISFTFNNDFLYYNNN